MIFTTEKLFVVPIGFCPEWDLNPRPLNSVQTLYISVLNKTDNVSSRLLPIRQWPHEDSCTWAHDVRLLIAATNKLKRAQKVKEGP